MRAPPLEPRAICRLLEPHLEPQRRERLERVLRRRILNLTVVLEDVHKPQNLSAAARTCEALGIQRLVVVEGHSSYRVNRLISQGGEKWLTLDRHQSAHEALAWLRANDFTVYASTLADDSLPLSECAPFAERSAFFFGNEHVGLSATIRRLADQRFRIPLQGFSRSLNVSAAVAMTLNEVLRSGFAAQHPQGEELWQLRAEWYQKSVRHSRRLLRESAARLGGAGGNR